MEPKPVEHSRRPAYPTRREVLAGAASLALVNLTWHIVIGAENPPGGIVAAPIFEHGEGRGATGCVVIVPPVFLSEEEALQIVKEELANHGVQLAPGTPLKELSIAPRCMQQVETGETSQETVHDDEDAALLRWMKMDEKNRKVVEDTEHAASLSSHIQGDNSCKEHCELGIRQLSVDPQGFLFPCVQFTAAGPSSPWCIGDVVSGIDLEKRNQLHDLSQGEKEPCCRCAIRRRCHNTCGCLNWQTTGSVTRVSPVLCRHEQILVAVADRIGETLYQERNLLFLHKHYNPADPLLSWIEDQSIRDANDA